MTGRAYRKWKPPGPQPVSSMISGLGFRYLAGIRSSAPNGSSRSKSRPRSKLERDPARFWPSGRIWTPALCGMPQK